MVTKLKVLVVGGGDTSEALLSDPAFKEIAEEIIVVERDPDRRSVFEKLGDVFFIEGDITTLPLHEYINLREVNAVLALTGRDEVNFLTLAVAHTHGVPIRIGLFRSRHIADIVKRLHLGIPIIKPTLIGKTLKQVTMTMVSTRELSATPAGRVYMISISETDAAVNSRLGDLKLEENNAYVLALIDDQGISPPSKDTVLEPGQVLLILAPNTDFIKKIRG
jgi:trk system potassium uptake protein TrkA